MSESAVLTVVMIGLALLLGGYLLYWAAVLLMAFARFVMDLHIVLVVLLFVLFPPSFLAFLAGYALLRTRQT